MEPNDDIRLDSANHPAQSAAGAEALEAARMFQLVMDNIPQGIFWKDRESRFLGCNKIIAEVAGLASPEEIVGKSDYGLPWKKEESDFFRMVDRRVMSSGVPEYHIIEPLLHADGKQSWLDTNKVPLRDASGQVIGILGTFEDITERKNAEEALRLSEQSLRESESNLSAVLENVRDIILSVDRDYRVLTMNHAGIQSFRELLGVDVKPGDRILDLIPARLAPAWKERYDRALAGERFTVEDPFENQGQITYAEVSFNPIRDGERIAGVSVFSRDITRRKQAETKLKQHQEELERLVEERTAELKKANQELEAFAYSVSHDLRAPLRSIAGFTRILREDYIAELDAEAHRIGDVIETNTHRMGQLIDDLLAFSRMGRVDMDVYTINMKSMAETVFLEIVKSNPDAAVEFHLDDLPDSIGDGKMIRQVWINLLTNAIKFSAGRDRARIDVSSRDLGPSVEYCVRDNGAGFNMKFADKLFGVFQRLHSEQEFPGTGVGLAIVQRVVQRHGGAVRAEGEKNAGAAFYFSLPKNPPPPTIRGPTATSSTR